MYHRTYFDQDNTIVKGSTKNLGSNPLGVLYYGGSIESPQYSRYLFRFPIDTLRDKYNDCELGDLSEVKHTLVLKPTRELGDSFMDTPLCAATSYELCLFRVEQEWEEGCGYDYDCACSCDGFISPNCNDSNGASNWFYATSTELWDTEGVYDSLSGDTVYLKCVKQSCDDCLLKVDMTPEVNDLITGGTENYGFGLAFNNAYELEPLGSNRYVGFYSKETTTFFKPYIETEYINPIIDDRSNFYIGKNNNLYLYTHLRGEPTNLDNDPIVEIYDEFDELYTTLTGECITKGVYGINFSIPATGDTQCVAWRDVWTNISIGGVQRPDVEMEFELKEDTDYYQLGFGTFNPKKYGFRARGIKREEFIRRGDVRKIIVDVYEQFKANKRVVVDNIFYRMYVKEGLEQLDVISWTPINIGACENYFYLDTSWLVPQEYFIEFKAVSNGEERTYGEYIQFTILDGEASC